MVSVLVEVGRKNQHDSTEEHADIKRHAVGWDASTRRLSKSTVALRIPRDRLKELVELSSVRYIEANTRLRPHLDLAHISANLETANAQRLVKEDGAGVLIGIVDTGIDTTHPGFWRGNQCRIVDYLDQTQNNRRYTAAEIAGAQSGNSPDEIGHGTHVAGIAAGNGGGSPGNRWAGVAPAADIAMVKTTFDSVDIAEAVAHLFELAQQRNQPCVVNLSLGGHAGGHDGSTVVERVIDELSGAGRVAVVSAGNEGDTNIHAGVEGLGPSNRWTARFELKPRLIQGQLLGLLWVQVWSLREDDLRVQLRSPNGELFEAPVENSQDFDRQVFFVSATHQRSRYSGDNNTTFSVVTVPSPQWIKGWSIIVTPKDSTKPTVGCVHAWILGDDMGQFTEGQVRSHLVGMPGTAFSAITVASYATRRNWTSIDPTQPNVMLDAVHLEDISYFSSPGPSRDGNNKPEVAAPGQWLLSTLSAKASTEEMPEWLRVAGAPYAALQGTSMAAPYVTGAVALLLQKNPALDWAEVKRRLMKSTRLDQNTKCTWNCRWGYGKIDVQRLLEVEPE